MAKRGGPAVLFPAQVRATAISVLGFEPDREADCLEWAQRSIDQMVEDSGKHSLFAQRVRALMCSTEVLHRRCPSVPCGSVSRQVEEEKVAVTCPIERNALVSSQEVVDSYCTPTIADELSICGACGHHGKCHTHTTVEVHGEVFGGIVTRGHEDVGRRTAGRVDFRRSGQVRVGSRQFSLFAI
eukprot:gene3280-124_t